MTDPATRDSNEPSPVESAIRRVKAVYGGWTRATSVDQMRKDWDELFPRGSLPAEEQRVDLGGLPATWLAAPGVRHDRVLLYLHGGGFRVGSSRSHRDLVVRLSAAANCRALALDYRRVPEHRFPAPLVDTYAAYAWLLEQGFGPGAVAFAGDSAGGNLVLSSLVTLRDGGSPLPVAAAAFSPWTDLTATRASYETRAEADPVHSRSMLLATAKAYLRDADPRDPRASPLFADLRGLPPLLLQVGDREVILDDSRDFAIAAEAAGVSVQTEVYDLMIHVFQQFAADLPQAEQAIFSFGNFLRRHWV